jgi:hypothetical protein
MISREAYRTIKEEAVKELRQARKKWRKAKKKAGLSRRLARYRRFQVPEIEQLPPKSEAGESLLNYNYNYRRLTTGLIEYLLNLFPCWVFRSGGAEFAGRSLHGLVEDTANRGTKKDLYALAHFITAHSITNGELMTWFQRDEELLLTGEEP